MRVLGLLAIGLAIALFYSFSPPEDTGELLIEIENVTVPEGIIWVGIYDSEEHYMVKEKAIVEGYEVNDTGRKMIRVNPLEYGNYAIALFHDINGNGELDRNWIGIPVEPYAFSKRPKTKWRLPRFREIVFAFERNHQQIKTQLRKWSD